MSQSENIQNLRKWEKRINAIKSLEEQETSLQDALKRALENEGNFRLKLLVKDERSKARPDSYPSDFEEFLSENGIVKITRDKKDSHYKTVLDIEFADDFLIEFLLYWYRRTQSAKDKILNKPL